MAFLSGLNIQLEAWQSPWILPVFHLHDLLGDYQTLSILKKLRVVLHGACKMVPVISLVVHRPHTVAVHIGILIGLGSIAGCGGERQQARPDAIVSPEKAPERPGEADTKNRHLRLESVDGVIVVSFRVTKILADEDGESIDMQLTSLVEDEGYKFLLRQSGIAPVLNN